VAQSMDVIRESAGGIALATLLPIRHRRGPCFANPAHRPPAAGRHSGWRTECR
jgi:hypothetical protein